MRSAYGSQMHDPSILHLLDRDVVLLGNPPGVRIHSRIGEDSLHPTTPDNRELVEAARCPG
jgi:hypothetical protein